MIMRELLFFIIAVLGSGALFSFGYRQYTEAMTRLGKPVVDKIFHTEGSGFAFSLTSLFDGFILGIVTGSGFSAISSLVNHLHVFNVSLKRSILLFAGTFLAVPVSLAVLTVFGYMYPLRALPFLLLTVSMCLSFAGSRDTRGLPEILSGLGLSFLSIFLLNGYFQLLPYNSSIVLALRLFLASPAGSLALFAVALALTVILRSYAATVIIALSLAFRGWISETDCWLILSAAFAGHPLLTVFTARGFSQTARRFARLRLFLHILCTPFLILAGYVLFPRNLEPSWIPRTAFMLVSITYGIISVCMYISHPLVALLRDTPYRTTEADDRQPGLSLVPFYLPDALETNLMLLKAALGGLARLDYEVLLHVMNSTQAEELTMDELVSLRIKTRSIERFALMVQDGLARLIELPCSPFQARSISSANDACRALREISEACLKIMAVFERTSRKQYRFHSEGRDELFSFTALVLDFLKYNSDVLSGRIVSSDSTLAKSMEDSIDSARNKLKKQARKSLEGGISPDIRGELAFIDVIEYLEHIGDNCLIVSKVL